MANSIFQVPDAVEGYDLSGKKIMVHDLAQPEATSTVKIDIEESWRVVAPYVVHIADSTADLSSLSHNTRYLVLVENIGLFAPLESADPPNDDTTFASADAGWLWEKKFSAGAGAAFDIVNIGSGSPDPDQPNTIQVKSDGSVYFVDKDGDIQQIEFPVSTPSLTSLTDVTITSPTRNDEFVFDNGSSNWINRTKKFVNVRDYGAVGDDTANDQPAIQAAITAAGAGGVIYIPKGSYYLNTTVSAGADQLNLLAGQTIYGDGNDTILRVSGNYRVMANRTYPSTRIDNCTIKGIYFKGSGKAGGNTWQTGLFLYGTKFSVSDCKFSDFSGDPIQNGGGGIFCSNLGTSNTDGGRIHNCYFVDNDGGLVFGQRGEYVTVSTCTMGGNTVGLLLGAGNVVIDGCIIHNNTTGIKSISGTNNAHNVISGCLANHNGTALNIEDAPHNTGYIITGSMFYYGGLIFKNSSNIKFTNCHFGFNDAGFTIDNSKNIQISSSWIGKTTGNAATPFSYINGGEEITMFGNVRTDDAVSIYWIKQVYADTILFRGVLETYNDIDIKQVGKKIKIATGSNASVGTATLVAGTVTVSTTAVSASSLIYVTVDTPGGTQGFLSVPVASITAATSFVINSSSNTETSTVRWWIIN